VLEYEVTKLNKKARFLSILMTCPRCGKKGKLIGNGTRTYGLALKIKHLDGTSCNYSYGTEHYDALLEIYHRERFKKRYNK